MTDQEIIQLLYDTGHFWSPLNPDGANVKPEELANLTLSDPVVVAAVRSYQDFLGVTLDALSLEEHARVSVPDGEVGPATKALFELPRCACPDYRNPEEVRSSGSGSWPRGCYDHDDVYEVQYTVDKSRMPESESDWLEVRNRVLTAYADIGVLLVEVESDANIDVEWRPLRGSTIGLAEFNGGSCRDNVFCYLDPSYWPNNEDVMDLWCHELGHNMNLDHTRGGIMNPVIINGGRFNGWTNSDPSTRVLKRYFDGNPVPNELRWWEEKPEPPTPPAPPAPGPGPGPDGIWIDGTAVVRDKDGRELGSFIFVPKPRV